MTGIAAIGCYLPLRRLPLAILVGRKPEVDGPERSVAWADEDCVTMAVAAARDCLRGRDRSAIDLVLFASTTHAFAEKQGARIIARALSLPATARTTDIAHTLRGGTQALQSAIDAVSAGRAREVLVVAADCRMGAPGSEIERNGGDAAVAILVAADGIVQLLGSVEHGEEIVDVWRRAGDQFVHGWEERFITQHGFLEPATAAARVLTIKFADMQPEFWRWAISAPDARSQTTLSSRLGAGKPTNFWGRIGFAGAADALLQLAGDLDQAQAGQRIALVCYGDGAEALLFEVAQAPACPVIAPWLSQRKTVDSLERYRRARDLTVTEYPPLDDQGISATVHFRERDENISLIGQRCVCGVHQFPKGRVCGACGRRDQFERENYAEARGRVVTYTLDAFFPSPDSPVPVAIIQVDDGPRIHLQIADIDAKDVAIGLPVRFAFRRIHQSGLRPNYFWKAIPVAGDSP